MLYRKTFVAASTLFDLVNLLHHKAFVGCRLGMNGDANSPPKAKD
jgi:hypothetical protein